MLGWHKHRWIALCLLFLALGSHLLFLYGFFPLKYHSGKLAHMDDLPNFIHEVSIDGQEVYNPGEHTVVLMVIDSLRYDFVTEEYMPYTAQLLKNKSACIYVSIAEPPTVTMPRIKAMMTGSVSTFADVALNFGAPAVRGDSVLRVAASRGRRSIMYGDDTWLRLFPGLWSESDGTTSFYVTDYTEVDNNVTRHLDKVLTPDEKNKPTFDFLVLHYLGLDHIGHLQGARSPQIKPKLLEMDEVVKKIFTAMEKWDRHGVLFICGDHGMRDAGGHGGASPAEVLVPLVVAKSADFQCPHALGPGPTVAQVDLAPTIAWLLNAPVPGDSAGRVLPALLPRDTRQHLYLLHTVAAHNAKQPDLPKDTEFYRQFQRAEKQFAQFLATGQQSAAKIAKEFYDESLAEMAKHLTETTVEFDLFALGVACLLLYVISATLLGVSLYSLQPAEPKISGIYCYKPSKIGVALAFLVLAAMSLFMLTASCFISETKSRICSFEPWWTVAFVLIGLVFALVYVIAKSTIEYTTDASVLKELNVIDYLLIGGSMFVAWSFLGTSFIEEEHMTWYYLWNTLMLFMLVRSITGLLMYVGQVWTGASAVRDKPELLKKMIGTVHMLPKWIMLLALHRYLRTLNQTGDRWLFLPDTADWLNEPENWRLLQAQMLIGTLATLVLCIRNLKYTNNICYIHAVLSVLSTLCILAYRVTTQSLYCPFSDVETWDPVIIVNVFWGLITAQFVFEILTYVGIFRNCGKKIKSNNTFEYNKPKAKTEDYIYQPLIEEPWNLSEVKLNLVRSVSHLMLNNMMLVIALLMRPHNVILIPSIHITCELTAKYLDHKLLDAKSCRHMEAVDVITQTFVHLWIGSVFFFYQGNSNSLASVDLGAGYVGLREYCPVRVAARMGLHAYAGPALAGCMLFCQIPVVAETWEQYLQTVWRVSNIFAFHRVYSISVYSVIAILFKHHLFVWSVFSPKLLYDLAATVFTLQALSTIAFIVLLAHFTSGLARIVTLKSRL
ncbi:GPI ethanolamine phosphate transferase 2 [Ostrinia nubilalis]|uniref:GPI ethanolamine phosphate transferase 2 n=1 Tax=Ostrinia nubilalis TaxID=29057 RepID=UPI00308267DE